MYTIQYVNAHILEEEGESAILKNTRLSEEQKAKWLKVMQNEYMSSEESGDDDTIVVHPIGWRSEYVNKMFQRIDAYCSSKKSSQARRQTKKRVTGSISSRPKPAVSTITWAISA